MRYNEYFVYNTIENIHSNSGYSAMQMNRYAETII